MFHKNNKGIVKIFLVFIFILVLTSLVWGLGITYYSVSESLTIGGPKKCITYSVFNDADNDVFVTTKVSDSLKQFLIGNGEAVLVPARTAQGNSVKVPVCFVASTFASVGSYKGIVSINTQPQGSGSGTAVSLAAGAPLTLKINPAQTIEGTSTASNQNVQRGSVFLPMIAIVLIILIIITLILRSKQQTRKKVSVARRSTRTKRRKK